MDCVDENRHDECTSEPSYGKFMKLLERAVMLYHLKKLIYKNCKIFDEWMSIGDNKHDKYKYEMNNTILEINTKKLIYGDLYDKVKYELERIEKEKMSFVLFTFTTNYILLTSIDARNVLRELLDFIRNVTDDYVKYNCIHHLYTWINALQLKLPFVYDTIENHDERKVAKSKFTTFYNTCFWLNATLSQVTDEKGIVFVSSSSLSYGDVLFTLKKLYDLLYPKMSKYCVFKITV